VTEPGGRLRRGARRTRTNLRGLQRLVRLGGPLKALRERPPDAPVTRDQLEELRRAWANPGYQADLDYLEMVCDHAISARSAVLECGSGLTTILLALTAVRRGIPVWSLEHDRRWFRSTKRVLVRFKLQGINLCFAPLTRHEGFAWYDVPLSLIPDRFGLVVCDGPPGSTPGGRGGLMSILGSRLAGSTILVDDAERPSESAMLEEWTREWAAVSHVRTTESGSQVVAVTIPDRTRDETRGDASWPSDVGQWRRR
jgi:hypothetical protein